MADITNVEIRNGMCFVHYSDGTLKPLVPATNDRWVSFIGNQTNTPPPVGNPGAGIQITAEMITAAVQSVGGSTSAMVDTAANIAASFNAAIAKAAPGILTSKKRAAVLVGECAQETDWFKTTTEYATTQAPYQGRGFIMLTWSSNYAAFGVWMKGKGLLTDENYFVNNPARLADLEWAPYTALFYFSKSWSGKTLWEICDESSSPWEAPSRAINTGDPYSTFPYNGAVQRATAIDAALAVTPDPPPPASGGMQDALVAWVTGKVGQYAYSQAGGRLSPDTSGYTDCSALLWYCYRQVAHIEIGQWTGGQQSYGSIIIDVGQPLDESKMVKGDLVFFTWGGYNLNFDHVEMYIGNGQICGHGGPGYGPVVKSLASNWGAASQRRVRRYV